MTLDNWLVDLDFVTEEVSAYFDEKGIDSKTWQRENAAGFLRRFPDAVASIWRQKEILVFSALHFGAIGLIAWLWGQMLGWEPDEFLGRGYFVMIAVPTWSYVCLVLMAYPSAFFTAATAAARLMRSEGRPLTMSACLEQALSNAPRLWVFYIWDEWQALGRLGDSLPLRGAMNANLRRRAVLAGVTHRAWKAGTAAMPAALSAGNDLLEAAEQSVSLLKTRSVEVMKLRSGYASICTIVLVAGGTATLMWWLLDPAWIAVPLVATIAVIQLVVRPIYVLAACDLYSDFRKRERAPVNHERKPARSERRAAKERGAKELARHRRSGANVLVAFVVACTVLSAMAAFRDEIGLGQLMASANVR